MNKKVEELLIVVDMINGFIKVGTLATPKISTIIPSQVELLMDFVKKNQGIIFMRDCHTMKSAEFKDYDNEASLTRGFPPHALKGTEEAEIVDELKPFTKYATIYDKNSTCSIFAPGFMNDIKKYKRLKRVIITGCCTDICIINLAIPLKNYFNQYNLDIEILVYEDMVETFDTPEHSREEYNSIALKLMRQSGIRLERRK